MIRVCFVCLGNICRSPSAEGVMRYLVAEAGLEHAIEVDSAGTAGYHAGEPPDARARAAGRRRGIEIKGRARRVEPTDFQSFDYVLAMDSSNFEDLLQVAPPELRHKVSMLRNFDAASPRNASVPDPYYGGDDGFDEVLDQCLAACAGLLRHIRETHGVH
ncbi:MAG: low molecular weight protein-tyrosine-phosphatase [Polyangiaceae bacterium]